VGRFLKNYNISEEIFWGRQSFDPNYGQWVTTRCYHNFVTWRTTYCKWASLFRCGWKPLGWV